MGLLWLVLRCIYFVVGVLDSDLTGVDLYTCIVCWLL